MANDASIGRHTLQQVQRLERNLQRLSGGAFKMPDHNRYGKEFLLIDQLKAINICLEGMMGGGAVVEAVDDLPEAPIEDAEPEMQPSDEPMVIDEPMEEEPQPGTKYIDMTLPQLKALAKKHGGAMAKLKDRTMLIEALIFADKAAEQVTTNGEE